MPIRIALAGNPNSGKTTLFNALTGSNQFVGNWPGVTVEKKEGKLKNNKDVVIMDLPGIYSLSPYTLEEVVSRNYLIDERPEAILNIIDGTNLERNLYLTTQLVELGIPVVVAVNMMDVVNRNKDTINTARLSKELGCPVFEISALKGQGINEAAEAAIEMVTSGKTEPQHRFSGSVEHTLAHIEEALLHNMPENQQRWYAIKLFERDSMIAEKLDLPQSSLGHIENDIKRCEQELDDDSESIITAERYAYIDSIIKECYQTTRKGKLSVSDKIDRVVTNRWLALPIFAFVMFVVYFVSVTTVGTRVTDWTNDGLFGDGWHWSGADAQAYELALEEYKIELETDPEALAPNPADFGPWVPGLKTILTDALERANCAPWLESLVIEGILAGVGGVIGFVPQMLILFIFLAFLEGCGYMARIAFIMDRVFRRFGLSGKSFIPMLIGTGCGVPAIMASRTIENERDRRMTIMTTTFIPCTAKLPIIAMLTGALFGGAWWVAPSAYFVGLAAIIVSGVILKKTKAFVGSTAPFIMELPAYHMPTVGNILRSMWERGWSFIKKAGTVILLSAVFVWFTSSFGFVNGRFAMVGMEQSILAAFGRAIAWVFYPLGWAHWRAPVAALTGLIAKENVVGTFGVLYGFAEVAEDGAEIWKQLATSFTALSAYSFLLFNLLCAPCFAAIGAIKREMNSAKWFWAAIGYQTGFAYVVSLCVYQLGTVFTGGGYSVFTALAFLLLSAFVWLLFRRPPTGGKVEPKTGRLIYRV